MTCGCTKTKKKKHKDCRARSKNAKGEGVEKVYDYVIACSSLKGRIPDMKVTDGF